MTTHYSIGHSPDPDDAFMFYAMTESLIDTGDRRYEHVLVDIILLRLADRSMRPLEVFFE